MDRTVPPAGYCVQTGHYVVQVFHRPGLIGWLERKLVGGGYEENILAWCPTFVEASVIAEALNEADPQGRLERTSARARAEELQIAYVDLASILKGDG